MVYFVDFVDVHLLLCNHCATLFQQYEYILVPYELRKCSILNSSFKLHLLSFILNLIYY